MKVASVVLSFFLILFGGADILKADTADLDGVLIEDSVSYVLDKCRGHDIVFLGTEHKQQPILEFISRLLPVLPDVGVTHLGIEVSSDQQVNIDQYLEYGVDLDKIIVHDALDCPSYRNLFKTIRSLRQTYKLEALAVDLPPSLYQSSFNRDEWMARSICKIFEGNRNAKVLVIVGNLHIFKNVAWKEHVSIRHASVRGYIAKANPDLRLFSISQFITGRNGVCDFSKNLADKEKPVAIDNKVGFRKWKLGVYEMLAAYPLNPYEIVDGVIVY